MSRTPFRIRVWWPDGEQATFDVLAVNVVTYGDETLEIHTEDGLTIQAPEDKEEADDARP